MMRRIVCNASTGLKWLNERYTRGKCQPTPIRTEIYWVVGHMDQAGGIAAVERAKGRVITVAIDAMTFIKPIRVGDVLEVYTEIENVGRTSIKIHIEAWAQ